MTSCRSFITLHGVRLRFIILLSVWVALWGSVAPLNAAVRIQWVDVRYFPEVSFKRIIEHFTGEEDAGGGCIMRTDRLGLAGMYWVVRLSHRVLGLQPGSQVRLVYIDSDSPEKHEKTLPVNFKSAYSRELYVGVTGEDWPSCKKGLVAWSLDILSPFEEILAHEESFLWKYHSGSPK